MSEPLKGMHTCAEGQKSSHQSGVITAPEAKDLGDRASDLIVRLKNRTATALAVGNSIPEYALPMEVIELLHEAAIQLEHQVNVALSWKFTAKSNAVALRDLERQRSAP